MKISLTLLFSIVIVLISPVSIWAQIPGVEAKNWYFGTGTDGLTFDSLGILNKVNNKMQGVGYEGMIVVNDPTTGELLFYSDGSSVIDKNHNIMENGTGLYGHYSGAQTVQCLPVPCIPKQYYLLTNDAWDLGSGKLYYSIVDFSDANYPNGIVKAKNTLISNIDFGQANKLIPQRGTSDYWWIGHAWNSNKYHVYKISNTGFTYSHEFTSNYTGESYTFAFSNVNQKLAIAGPMGTILFSFNPLNGQISNEVRLSNTSSSLGNFSPDGSKLYFNQYQANVLRLHQYDLNTGVITNMNTCCYGHDVKIAPNGKMYFIHTYNSSTPLAVINKPNLSAISNACELENLPFQFNGEVRRFPEFVTLPFASLELNKTVDSCSMQARISVIHNIESDSLVYKWYLNGVEIANQVTNSITVRQSGNYELRVSAFHNCPNLPNIYTVATNITFPPPIVIQNVQISPSACNQTSGNGSITVAASGGISFQYSLDSINFTNSNQFTGLSAGQYTVYVKNETGCISSKQVNLICIEPTACSESKRANIWYFGNSAGITFNNGSPTALTDGVMNQAEGNSTISDSTGNLLFYTNGISVWNKQHNVMLNGQNLMGGNEAAQSAIIVPKPQSNSIYYIFTVSDWWDNTSALRYSIVDMSLDGGNGAITEKNILVKNNIREQITAVRSNKCNQIWIVTHEKDNNKFLSYSINQNGLDTIPIISPIGMIYNGFNRYGYLKFSHNGSKLCSTFGGSNDATVELYDFNISSGIVSNPINIASNNATSDAYSSEFSPDGTKLYVVAYNNSFIDQYDISSGIPSNIATSKTNIANETSIKACLQIGPDRKIYASRNGNPFLGVINFPNNSGLSCNYVDNGVDLNGRNAGLGLPNFIQSYFAPTKPKIKGETTTCASTTKTYQLSAIRSCNTTVQWQVLDNNATIQNPTDTSVSVLLPASGQVRLEATVADVCTSEKDTLIINVGAAITITPSVTMPICGSANGLITVNATGGTNLQYSLDSIRFTNSNQFTGLTAGQYTVYVKNETGCISSKKVNLTCTPPTTCSESKRANVWYFGFGAGLDFNTCPPTVLTNGKINTLEGVATISDSSGKLLFYTDGISVWNKNHQLMPNGTGLLGNPSATHSAIIIPLPNNLNIYYIFTTDALENGYQNGFRYSIVDIRLNSGLGDVTTKNQLLIQKATERICAIKHKNNGDIWVIAQDKLNNTNNAYLVTQNGIAGNPIISPVGLNIEQYDYGYFKPSLQGNQIVGAYSHNEAIVICNFDNSTGIISNPTVLTSPNFAKVYGVEFSPDGNLLYTSFLFHNPARLVQFNLKAGSINQIMASMVEIASYNIENFYGALQTAPDGKIYVSNAYTLGVPSQSSSVGIIHKPNVIGIGCTFQDQALRFDPVKTFLGLPTFIQSYFVPTKPKISGDTNPCPLTTKTYQLETIRSCNTTIQWRVLDNNATLQNQTDSSVSLLLPMSGQVRLVATGTNVCASESDTLNIKISSTCIQTTCSESKRANVWYFGYGAGLDFNTSPPTVLTGGQVNTFEGCATMSDSLGRLLFYTDGISVWNKNHQKMPNGVGLLGNSLSTHSGIIIPIPKSPNLYYIFTTDAMENNYQNGLRYSIVDMNLAGGLGDVTTKNQILIPFSSEKVCAVKHKNNCDIWVIAKERGNNIFRSYLITSAGLNTSYISSAVGSIQSDPALGCLKPSASGKKIVNTIHNSGLDIFDFDSNTGILSNPIALQSPNFIYLYGIEFSSDDKILYVSRFVPPAKIFQLDISSQNANLIMASAVELASRQDNMWYSGLQMAPDKKIYISNALFDGQQPIPALSALSVIENPDILGRGCNYREFAVDISPGKLGMGLPTIIQSYYALTKPKISGETTVCSSTTKTYQLSAIRSCNTTVQWRVLDNNATIQNPTDTSVSVLLPASGQVRLEATVADVCTSEKDTLIINVGASFTVTPSVTLPVCGSTNGTIVVNASGSGVFQYSLDSINFRSNNTFSGLSSGLYTVYVKSEAGCVNSKQVILLCPSTDACPSVGPNLIVNGDFEQGYYGFTSDFGRGTNNATRTGCPDLGQGWIVVTKFDVLIPSSSCVKYPSNLSQIYGQPNTVTDSNPNHSSNTSVITQRDCSYSPIADHTSGNGYFLVIDPDDVDNRAYWKQNIEVCPNTDYIFSVWVRNLFNSSPNPTFHFEIGGVPINAPTRYPLSQWTQTFARWNSRNISGNVTIKLVNDQRGCNGNDVALDDVFFGVCGGTILTCDTLAQICKNSSLRLSGSSFGFSPPQYQWQKMNAQTRIWENIANATDTVYKINATSLTDTGFYRLISAAFGNSLNSNCAVASKIIKVVSVSLPIITFSPLTASCNKNNGSITVNINGTAPYTFQWSNGATSQNINNLRSGNYKITTTDRNGCKATDSITVGNIPPPSVSTTITASTCEQANGSITVLATGGTTRQFSKDNVTYSSSNRFDGLKAGSYRIYVKNEACDTFVDVSMTNIGKKDTTTLFKNTCDSTKTPRQTDILQNRSGCDSMIITNWTYIPPKTIRQNLVICADEKLRVGDSIYTKSGNYRNILRGYLGCDSIVLTNLTVIPRAVRTIDTTICANQSISANNKTYRLAGIYRDTIRRASPLCDSVLIIILKTKTLFSRSQEVVICKGKPYNLYGKTYSQTGIFTDTFRFPNSCDSVITTDIKIIDLQLKMLNTLELNKGDSIQLTPMYLHRNSLKWEWVPKDKGLDCWDCPNPVLKASGRTLFQVVLRDTVFDCIEKAEILVEVNDCKVFIPTAFSPNGDGNNDFFKAYKQPCAKQIKSMRIFNRWGGLVYMSFGETEGWDGTFNGKALASDVYVCYVEVELGDGSIELFKGDVTLMR